MGVTTGLPDCIRIQLRALIKMYFFSPFNRRVCIIYLRSDQGFKGAALGVGRGIMNATMKPAAGLVGFVAQPLHGAKKLLEGVMKRGTKLPSTRIQDGLEAVRTVTREETNALLVKFERLKWSTKERQADYARMAKEAMQEAGQPVTMKRTRTDKKKDKTSFDYQSSPSALSPSTSASGTSTAVSLSSAAPGSTSRRLDRSPMTIEPRNITQRSSELSGRTLLQEETPRYLITEDQSYWSEQEEEDSHTSDRRDPQTSIQMYPASRSYYTEDRVEEMYARDLAMAIQLS
jgi:hypothetical protein